MLKKIVIGFGVLVIVGGIVGTVLFKRSLQEFQDKSKAILVQSALTSWYVSLEMHKAESGKYPILLSDVEMKPPIDDDITILYESDGETYVMTGSREDIQMKMNEKKELTNADGSSIQ